MHYKGNINIKWYKNIGVDARVERREQEKEERVKNDSCMNI